MTNEERLRWLAARFDMTSTARYEEDSERFYAETGYMAPGKDVPMAMGGQDEDERRHAHIAWVDAMAKSNQSAMLAGAEALRRIEANVKGAADCAGITAKTDALQARHEALRADVMTVVSDPHLTWAQARKALTAALNK